MERAYLTHVGSLVGAVGGVHGGRALGVMATVIEFRHLHKYTTRDTGTRELTTFRLIFVEAEKGRFIRACSATYKSNPV